MNRLLLGDLESKKERIVDLINRTEGKLIIISSTNLYKGYTEQEFVLEKLNPVLGKNSIFDAIAINAAYLKNSCYLKQTCQEILDETKETEKEYLIEEGMIRLQISWSESRNEDGNKLKHRMPKRNKLQVSLEEAVEEILAKRVTLIQAKGKHYDSIRGNIFTLLSRISQTSNEPITIFIDEVPNVFGRNIPMWLESIDLSKLTFLFSWSKIGNISTSLLPIVDEIEIASLAGTEKKELSKILQIEESSIELALKNKTIIKNKKTSEEVLV